MATTPKVLLNLFKEYFKKIFLKNFVKIRRFFKTDENKEN